MRTPRLLRLAVRRVYLRIPAIHPIWQRVFAFLHPAPFSGWGLSTYHAFPWDDEHDWGHLREAFETVRAFEHGPESDTGVSARSIDQLRWRNSIVAFCARYAVRFNPEPVSLVDCGVSDGVSAFFACVEADQHGADFTLHCYDSWTTMRDEDFLPAEVKHRGAYYTLSLERTQRNLAKFSDRIVYHEGYVPDTFGVPPEGPEMVAYLSIDLNAAKPTIATLDHFLPKMGTRGIVLFDDYGHIGYRETRLAIDAYFKDRPGVLFKLPTGQAAYFC